jgi:hypothetical protein
VFAKSGILEIHHEETKCAKVFKGFLRVLGVLVVRVLTVRELDHDFANALAIESCSLEFTPGLLYSEFNLEFTPSIANYAERLRIINSLIR